MRGPLRSRCPPRSPDAWGGRDAGGRVTAPRTVRADAQEPVRHRQLGIRTDSPPPDWDTAATLPGTPVRPPVPVLS
ncbi:hypothetical protein BZZ08_06937 [Streptomyces sp. MH60]|nr:hypothetical protein BZZ08_06937 [Streptomyces sp. MH60]